MNENQERQLCTVRTVAEIKPIEGADFICTYSVDGWKIVDSVGKYQIGQMVLMFEIDSWVPTEIAPFLSKGKEPKEYGGVLGERLRTVKLKGQVSQGLILPISMVDEIHDSNCVFYVKRADGAIRYVNEDDDLTDFFGIQKWEKPMNAQLAGMAKGNFPHFIPKTDQPRIQNLGRNWNKLQTQSFEVTEKLDGSSMTVYVMGEVDGVCSRNLDLKQEGGSVFWMVALRDDMHKAIRSTGANLAIQGELIGPGIQGNPYGCVEPKFYCYDIFDIDKQEYLLPDERQRLCFNLGIAHVPVVHLNTKITDMTTEELLEKADGFSKLNSKANREGFVFKSITTQDSFKVISNKWLLKNEG